MFVWDCFSAICTTIAQTHISSQCTNVDFETHLWGLTKKELEPDYAETRLGRLTLSKAKRASAADTWESARLYLRRRSCLPVCLNTVRGSSPGGPSCSESHNFVRYNWKEMCVRYFVILHYGFVVDHSLLVYGVIARRIITAREDHPRFHLIVDSKKYHRLLRLIEPRPRHLDFQAA